MSNTQLTKSQSIIKVGRGKIIKLHLYLVAYLYFARAEVAKRFNKLFLAIAQVALRFKENKSFLRFIVLRTEKIYNSVHIIALRTEKNLVACALLRCALSEVEILRCALSD